MVKGKLQTFEYSGSVWMKRKQNVYNKLRTSHGIRKNQIKKIIFDKRTKPPGVKFKAIVVVRAKLRKKKR